jgi:asparagine synthase (glutamine-hydrolysing)
MTLAGASRQADHLEFDISRALTAENGGLRPPMRRWRGDGPEFGCGPAGQILVEGPIAIVADARIDNRDALIRAFAPHAEPNIADAGLLLLAWKRWGEDFLDHVYGDIACALWDGRRLVLGRDAMGYRPLHFHRKADRWLFSATPAGLLTDPEIPCALDEQFLAEAIVQLPHEGTASAYRGISRVPPGHLAIIEGETLRLHRYWRPERIGRLRLANRQAYADALRASLDEAVRCRLPATGLIGCELSAGLDSATIACLAARQLAAQGRSLVAFTAVPSDPVDERKYPGRILDEGPLAALVAGRYPNVEHIRVSSRGRGNLFAMVDTHSLATREMEIPSPNGLWADAIGETANRRGIRVMLEAGTGNVTASYHGLHHLPALARGARLLPLADAWRGLRRWDRTDWPWSRLAYHTAAPLLPPPLVGHLRRMAGRPAGEPISLYGVNREFARSTGVDARLAARAAEDRARSAADWRLSMLGDCGTVAANRLLHGLDVRDPMADRRLFELCLSIPPEQFLHHGEPRALLRLAMAGIVPDEILYERRRGLQSADWPERFKEARADFAAEMTRLEASPLACRVLDVPGLRRLIDHWPATTAEWHGRASRDGVLLTLTQAFGAGRFLRQFETGNQ